MIKAGAHAIWAVVVLVVAILGALVTLAALGRDTSPITGIVTTVVAPLLLAMVYGEIRAVREQTNGTTSKLVEAATRPIAPIETQRTDNPSTAPAPVSSPIGR